VVVTQPLEAASVVVRIVVVVSAIVVEVSVVKCTVVVSVVLVEAVVVVTLDLRVTGGATSFFLHSFRACSSLVRFTLISTREELSSMDISQFRCIREKKRWSFQVLSIDENRVKPVSIRSWFSFKRHSSKEVTGGTVGLQYPSMPEAITNNTTIFIATCA